MTVALPDKPPVAVAHAPDGVKKADAPANWPFGTIPPETAVEPPQAPPVKAVKKSPLELLQEIIDDEGEDIKVRMQAAAIAAPFVHARIAPIGKKESKDAAAKAAGGSGRFSAAAPPLKLVGR